jgi:hypothetical protein
MESRYRYKRVGTGPCHVARRSPQHIHSLVSNSAIPRACNSTESHRNHLSNPKQTDSKHSWRPAPYVRKYAKLRLRVPAERCSCADVHPWMPVTDTRRWEIPYQMAMFRGSPSPSARRWKSNARRPAGLVVWNGRRGTPDVFGILKRMPLLTPSEVQPTLGSPPKDPKDRVIRGKPLAHSIHQHRSNPLASSTF